MRRSRQTALAVTLLALLLAACGSSSSSSSSSPSGASGSAATSVASATPAADTGGASGKPITVGFVCSCTGALATSLSSTPQAIAVWAKWTNAHGGINGHPVKVITIDDGQDPAKGLEAVKTLVEQDKVVAIVGQESGISQTWAKYISSTGVPVVGGVSVDSSFLTSPDFFSSGSNLLMNLFGEVALAKQTGKKNLGLFYCAETPVCAQLPPLLTALAKPMGVTVSAVRVSSTAPSYIAPCLALKQKGIDSIVVAMGSAVIPRVLDACSEQGFHPENVTSSATVQSSWTKDANLNGSYIAATDAVYTDTAVPGVSQFAQAMRQYAPALTSDPQYGWTFLEEWAGGQMFAAAAKAAKLTPSSTPADVKKGLYALKNETLGGIAPPLNFTPGKPGFPACGFQAKLSGGQFQPLNGDRPVCVPAAVVAQMAAALNG